MDILITLLQESPFIAMLVMLTVAIRALWQSNSKKDKQILDLAEGTIKIAAIYEKNVDGIATSEKEITKDHSAIIRILEDIKSIVSSYKK